MLQPEKKSSECSATKMTQNDIAGQSIPNSYIFKSMSIKVVNKRVVVYKSVYYTIDTEPTVPPMTLHQKGQVLLLDEPLPP